MKVKCWCDIKYVFIIILVEVGFVIVVYIGFVLLVREI